MEGIYSITFRGTSDWGMGMLLFRAGRLTGADFSGVLYDGTYRDANGMVTVAAELTVPPGSTLVQGIPARPVAYKVPFNAEVPRQAFSSGQPVLIQLPVGPVNVIFKFLRGLE
ncbi:hypothetical protein JQ600_08045 [Bradyrhizobium sp. AUGA SZCCT0176]|uniref:hypothetical protein n=1 Tax=Bradyrhizobium sp. AUGA SZCCT0176 TaxID=2807664 RepID=UPI001BAAA365|nr:hypothetical protein [Bradyrhizobium sp. AUGA SZCCT0176]MBR1224866.1 hypothetical protein [Bradyrhizobium sp. AUGA SZCCT0176]